MATRAELRVERSEHSGPVSTKAVYAALAGLATLTSGGIWLLMVVDERLSVGAATVQMAVKFTNLTVVLVAVVSAWIAIGGSGELRSAVHLTAIVMAVVTSVVNMTLLGASLPGGWWGVVDLSQHYVIPVAVVVSWAVVGPSVALRSSRLGLVLLVPLAWLVFVLGRGAATGSYPYDFLDVPETGWTSVLATAGAILVAMLALTFGARAVDRRRYGTRDD